MIYRRYDKVDPSPTERSNGHTLRPLKAATSLLLLASKATKETPKARVHKVSGLKWQRDQVGRLVVLPPIGQKEANLIRRDPSHQMLHINIQTVLLM